MIRSRWTDRVRCRALRLGGEERLEDLGQILPLDPGARVDELEQDLVSSSGLMRLRTVSVPRESMASMH